MDPKEALELSLQSIRISQLKDKQEEAILMFACGKDTFVSLPTGYGKLLIFRDFTARKCQVSKHASISYLQEES